MSFFTIFLHLIRDIASVGNMIPYLSPMSTKRKLSTGRGSLLDSSHLIKS